MLEMDNRKISLCIPTYNRFLYTVEAFKNVLEDSRISEVVISDDASTDDSYERLQRGFEHHEKVKLFRNEKNMDCYLNKREAIRHAINEWCILLDSDNVIYKDYIDRLYELEWEPTCVYSPSWARPLFDYRAFEGKNIDKNNISHFIDQGNFTTLLNTSNYFINKEEYLLCFDEKACPVTSDSIYMNYNWFHSGNSMYVVPGLYYNHTIHSESHYVKNNHKTPVGFHESIIDKLKKLK